MPPPWPPRPKPPCPPRASADSTLKASAPTAAVSANARVVIFLFMAEPHPSWLGAGERPRSSQRMRFSGAAVGAAAHDGADSSRRGELEPSLSNSGAGDGRTLARATGLEPA